jgi:hypoxia-inducible factor 1-alpha inhibitor (HIF hydroxylase)
MDGDKKPWDASQLRKYDLTLDEIPKLRYDDPKIDEYIKANVSKAAKCGEVTNT